MKRWRIISLAIVAIALLAGLLLLARPWGSEQAAAQEPVPIVVSLDMETSDGPCTDIDATAFHDPGTIYDIGLCVSGLYAAAGGFTGTGIGTLAFDVLYDDLLNVAPEVANSGNGLDDNPDANAGSTIWGDGLGSGWDCSTGGIAYPMGDKNPASGPGNGWAFLQCTSLAGPWTLGDDETSGVIAVIHFQAIAAGEDTLTIANGLLGFPDASEMGTCNPAYNWEMTCNGGTESKSGEPPPPTATPTATRTSTPTPWCGGPGQPTCPTSTPTPRAWTMTPTPPPTDTPEAPPPPAEEPTLPPPPPPPGGGQQPVVVPPPTGQGSDSGVSPAAAGLIGIACAGALLVGTGLVLRRVRSR
ncbi:MAG: hypothetical protein QME71_05870 [Dehalococcoidia bacterium]|nr:hypothetical protein [Dehalococcoidia bacterium]